MLHITAKYYFTTAFFTTSLSTTMTDVTIPKYHVILSRTRVRIVNFHFLTILTLVPLPLNTYNIEKSIYGGVTYETFLQQISCHYGRSSHPVFGLLPHKTGC